MGLKIQTAESASTQAPVATEQPTIPPTPAVEPIVEKPIETPQAKTEAPPQIDETSALSFISERVGKPFQSINEINELIQKASIEPENPFADNEIASLNKFVKETGRTPQEYYKYIATDFNAMDDLSVVRQLFREQNPNLSDNEINDYIETEFKLDPEEYSEKEINASKFKLSQYAKEARNAFNKLKQDYAAPKQAESNATSEMEKKAFEKAISQVSLEEIEIDGMTGDKLENILSYKVSQDEIAAAKEELSLLPPSYLKAFSDENGNVDYANAIAERVIVNNIDKIVQIAIQKGQTMANEKIVTETKNPSFPNLSSAAPPINEGVQSVIQQIRANQKKGGLKIR